MSHSTHTRQVPFGDCKEADRELQRVTRPGTPASATHKDQTTSLVGSPLKVIHTLTIAPCMSGFIASQMQVQNVLTSSVVVSTSTVVLLTRTMDGLTGTVVKGDF